MEKTVEVVEAEDGVRVVVRPMFPFVSETYRLVGTSLTLSGPTERISLKLSEEQAELIGRAESLTLSEFAKSGQEPQREMILFPI